MAILAVAETMICQLGDGVIHRALGIRQRSGAMNGAHTSGMRYA